MNKLQLRIEFLKELLTIENKSGDELKIRNIAIKELNGLGFTVQTDSYGNVYATRGQSDAYALINAHMDMVDISYSAYGYSSLGAYGGCRSVFGGTDKTEYLFDYLTFDEIIEISPNCSTCKNKYKCELDSFCKTGNLEKYEASYLTKYSEIKRVKSEEPEYYKQAEDEYSAYDEGYSDASYYGYDEKMESPKDDWKLVHKKGKIYGRGGDRVLGGDDKNGIFIALEVARLNPTLPMKILFTVEEELGCIGIGKFLKDHSEWLNDVKYSLTIDRKEGNHLLTSQCGVRSMGKVLGNKLKAEGEKVGINVLIQDGSISDTVHLREYVPAVNISAGYYSPHSESEYVKVKDVVAITEWVSGIVNNV